ncbi:MAG: hypothetical protein ACLTOZ_04700 [[Clostridium] leptum]
MGSTLPKQTWYFQNFGDLAEPMAFGFDGPDYFGKLGHRINLDRFMIASSPCVFILSWHLSFETSATEFDCLLCGLSASYVAGHFPASIIHAQRVGQLCSHCLPLRVIWVVREAQRWLNDFDQMGNS